LFVHPVQFLATAADGSILKDELLGALGTHPPEGWSHTEVHCNHSILRGLLIAPEQVGGERDQSGVVYFDLPLPLVH